MLPVKNKATSRDHSLKECKPFSASREKEKPVKKAFNKLALSTNKALTLNNNIKAKPSTTKAEVEKKKPQLNKSENLKKKL